MPDRVFVFEASWDDEAKVWWTSETPIQGVVAEASTVEELYQKLSVLIPEMLELRNESYTRDSLPISIKTFKECATV